MKTKTHFSLLATSTLLLASSAFASEVEVPNEFAAGTPALADEVNANFRALQAGVNDNDTRLSQMEILVGDHEERISDNFDVGALNAQGVAANAASIGTLDSRVSANEEAIATIARPERVLEVATSGTEFTSVVAALASIDDASSANRYLVKVGPGVFEETELVTVPEFVRVQGAGIGTTILRSDRSGTAQNATAAAVLLEEGGRIGALTIRNNGASSTFSIGILGFGHTRNTVIDGVEVIVNGTGGVGHFALRLDGCDTTVQNSSFIASGANASTSVNAALSSVDGFGGAFSQPLLRNSSFQGIGLNDSGFGLSLIDTAATVIECLIDGDFRGVSSASGGISRIHRSSIETFALNSCLETDSQSSILSATTSFQGGNTAGFASNTVFVHCYKSNFQAIVNGSGSTVQ